MFPIIQVTAKPVQFSGFWADRKARQEQEKARRNAEIVAETERRRKFYDDLDQLYQKVFVGEAPRLSQLKARGGGSLYNPTRELHGLLQSDSQQYRIAAGFAKKDRLDWMNLQSMSSPEELDLRFPDDSWIAHIRYTDTKGQVHEREVDLGYSDQGYAVYQNMINPLAELLKAAA